jgi:hypothetical protein
MTANEKLQLLALDLTKTYPRSPRETLAGYVIAARCLDKCRSVVAGTAGEYHSGCPLDMMFLEFVGITFEDFKAFVATGATDTEVAAWITEKAKKRERIEIIRWNNDLRYKRVSELPDKLQEYMEDYIPQFTPKSHPVYHFFDIYDLEEERL